MRRFVALLGILCANYLAAQLPRPGVLPHEWRTSGPKCVEIPEFQVHEYNADFFILRQSGCTNFEKPFLYLLFGNDRALLVDSGAGEVDVAAAVEGVRRHWLKSRGRETIPLVVAHSHAHGDHIAGDAQLRRLPNTTALAPSLDAVRKFFRISDWPHQIVTFDLGGRVLDIVPIPGHEPASIAIYDRQTAVLLTGDTLYPGRLFVDDDRAYIESITRLVHFTASHPVAHILGCHIENTRIPFVDFPPGTIFQPDEHELALGRAHLLELHDALQAMSGTIVTRALRDFVIVP